MQALSMLPWPARTVAGMVWPRLSDDTRALLMQTAMRAMGNMSETKRRVALACIPAALTIAFIPHAVKLFVMVSKLKKYDNVEPRKHMASIEGDTPAERLVRRCQACHANGLETFAMFSAACLSAFAAKAKSGAVMRNSLNFVIGRIVYTAFYLGGINEAVSALRTLAFFHNMHCCIELFKLAAKAPLAQK